MSICSTFLFLLQYCQETQGALVANVTTQQCYPIVLNITKTKKKLKNNKVQLAAGGNSFRARFGYAIVL